MQFSVLGDQLKEMMGEVNKAVATSATLPITQNVHLKAEKGMLYITATNLEMLKQARHPVMIEEEGETTVPAGLFGDIINNSKAERFDFHLEESLLHLSRGRAKSNIICAKASEFPPMPTMNPDVYIEVSAQVLAEAIRSTQMCIANSIDRPVLNGLYLVVEKDYFEVAAADGFRMAIYRHNFEKELPIDRMYECIIPRKSALEIYRMFAKAGDTKTVTLQVSDEAISLDSGVAFFFSTLINGTFPDYRKLVPEISEKYLLADIETLRGSVRRPGLFSKNQNHMVKMRGAGNRMLLRGDGDLGHAIDTMDCEVHGEGEMWTAVNDGFLKDGLTCFPKGQVRIESKEEKAPLVLRNTDADNYVHVIMPMFVDFDKKQMAFPEDARK